MKEAKKNEDKKLKSTSKAKKGKPVNEKKLKNKNKKSKKNIIIIILSIVIVILVAVIGCLVYRSTLENKTTGSTWTDKYYEFLKEQSRSKKVNDSLKEKSNISFVQSESMKNPMMIVKSKYKDGKYNYEYIAVFGIVDDSVKFFNGFSSSEADVKLYYNLDKKKYKYYIYNKNDTFETYTSLDTVKYDYDNYNLAKLLDEKGITGYDSEEYNEAVKEFYEKQDKDTNREVIMIYDDDKKVEQKTLDGKNLEYNKIDEKLVDTGVEPKYFDYKKDMNVLDLREEVVEGKENYKDIDALLTKAIEKVVKEQIELVEKVKQDIENAKAEIKADEEKKAKEAEAALYAKGLTIGNYNLKYGTYTTSVPHGGVNGNDLYGTITLKPNGAFHIKTNFEQSSGNTKTIDEDGTYTTGRSLNSYDSQDTIFFKTNSGYKFSYFVTNNSYFNSQWIIYNYSGN